MPYEDDVEFFEFAEGFVASQVDFIDFVLREIKKRDKECKQVLGDSYGKAIGFLTPFREASGELRKVRTELGLYLMTTRMFLKEKYKKQFKPYKKKKNRNGEISSPREL